MKKRVASILLCFVLICMMLPLTARADTGPKPSVRITFTNMGDTLCYGTLLSEQSSTGPASVWDGNEDHIYSNGLDMEIWRAFAEYEDADGYYFLQWGWQVNETKKLAWTYYPPSRFKILLYYPETQTFVVSGIYERYAFDSYFAVDMDAAANGAILTAEKNYGYTLETVSLICRIVITILLEIGVAWLFGLRQKKLITLISAVNIVTQIALNLLLNFINYRNGYLVFVIYYIRLELLVFAIEAIAYLLLFPRYDEGKISRGRTVGYAFTANAVSFIAGLALAMLIPGIF